MYKNSFKLLVACGILSGCNGATFSGGAKQGARVLNSDGQNANPDTSNADPAKQSTLDFKLAVDASETTETFEFNDSVAVQKELTLKANYIDVTKSDYVKMSQAHVYTMRNSDGRIYTKKRRLYDTKFVDIILVVDNSSSMSAPQQKLANAIPAFKDSLAGFNWRIILTSSDNNLPCAIKVFDSQSTATEIANAVKLGTAGSDQETPLNQAFNIIAGKCAAAKIRPEAAPAVFILTNEDECSTGTIGNCPVVAGKQVGILKYFGQNVNAISDMSQLDITLGMIAWLPSDSVCSDGITKANTLYGNITSTSLGSSRAMGSICQNDYSATLSDFSTKIKGIPDPFKSDLTLMSGVTVTPIDGSQKVTFSDGSVVKSPEVYFETRNFVINKKSAYFGKGATYYFEQRDVARTNIIKWTTDYKGSCDSSLQYVGGLSITNLNTGRYIAQSQADFPTYTLKTNLCQLELTQPLPYPYHFSIVKAYGTPVALKLDIGINAVVSSLVVKVDGVLKQSGYSVDSNGILSFSPMLTSGTVIATYKSLNDPIIKYDVGIPSDASELTVSDFVSGDNVSYQREGTAIVLNRSDIIDNRKLDIKYKLLGNSSKKVFLGHIPVNSDDLVKYLQNLCSLSEATLSQVYNPIENSVDLKSCVQSTGTKSVDITYKHYSTDLLFKLPLSESQSAMVEKVEAKLNGEPLTGFDLQNGVLKLPKNIALGEIEIKVLFKE